MKATDPAEADKSDKASDKKTSGKSVWYKSRLLMLVIGLILGVAAMLAIRFVTYSPEHVHYHANFAVYLNGQRDEFKGAQYYESVSICSASNGISIPQQRAHMHDNINSVVHVHDHATTWGQFFNNLGWYIGPDFIETDDGTMYRESGDTKLHIVINGQDYTDLSPITNMVIQDKSRLLVSFGDISDATLQQEYKTVPSTAAHYDASIDPASCSGADVITTSERLHHLF
jgi:hypothetical protein